MNDISNYDVVVIGAGIIGSMIARELSKYEGRMGLVEKKSSPGWGVSKGSLSMIHAPDFCPPGTLKGKLCVGAPERFKKLSQELDVAYREVDELWLALEPSQIRMIEDAKARGEGHGGKGFQIIRGDEVRALEPHVNPKVVAALYIRGLGVVYPPEWAFALVENGVQNGLRCHFNTEVQDIAKDKDEGYLVQTSRGPLRARWIVNAAGLFADEIAAMVGDRGIRLELTKGTMAIFSKSVSGLVRHMVYGTFSRQHSQAITPTVHGNLLAGLGHFSTPEQKTDYRVEVAGLQDMIRMAKELIPALDEDAIITTFAGIRSENNRVPNGDFFLSPSEHAPGVIHAVIGQPGLTAAPAIAERVVEMLSREGFPLRKKSHFQPKRLSWPVFSEADEATRQGLIRSDPRYGRIVCRCENVSEREIVEAIHRGADSLDAVKHVTRAGMGCCQGGYCGTRVFHLVARELGKRHWEITKKGKGSFVAASS